MIRILEKYHKIINLILLSIIILTYMFRDLKCLDYGTMYMMNIVNVRNIVGIIMFVIILINAVNKKYNIRTLILIVISMAFYGWISIKTETRDFLYGLDLLFYVLIVVACEDIDYNVIIKVVFLSFVVSWIIVFIRTLINEVQIITDINLVSSRVRLSLGYGFGNAALFGFIFFYLCLYYIYVRKHKIHVYEFAILFVLNCICFYICNTRSVFVCVTIAILTSIVIKYNQKYNLYLDIYKYIMYIAIVLAVFIALVLPMLYDPSNGVLVIINSLLTNRLELGQNAINNTALTLFGQLTEFERTSPNWVYNVVDSSYLRYLLTYGIIPFVILVIQMIYFAYLIDKKRDLYLFVIFLLMQLRFITELDLFPVMRYNYFFFIWSYYNSIYTNSRIIVGDKSNIINSNLN